MAVERKQFSIDVGGKTLTLEISRLAEQTNAAVLGRYGETTVLTTVVMGESETTLDYLPLKVDYEEKFYAAGKVIGSRFIRREGRPSEEAILTGRLVDRVIRPLFDDRIRREIQVVVTVLSYDEKNDPDFVGLMSASTALGISDVPWRGPVSGVRVAKIGDHLLINPDNSALKDEAFSFESFVAGPRNIINMIELAGGEAEEAEVVRSFETAQKEIDRLIDFQDGIIKEIGKPKTAVAIREAPQEVKATAAEFLLSRLAAALYVKDKGTQRANLTSLKAELEAHLRDTHGEEALVYLRALYEDALDALVRKSILEEEKRPDGRGLEEVRPLNAEVSLLKRTHGSAVFMRGNTQALAVVTLAPPGAEQLIETMEVTGKRRFLLHYNFPPYSVHEIGSFRGPGRREIGHGALAEKALKRLIPPKEEFPYTIRVVSEILSSNGSSSMATVCASSLALMDAGVPLAKHAAGIAMGLVSDEDGNYKIVTDIQGPEDHYGDMDFKVAGTEEGVLAIQLDVKVRGLTIPMVREALVRAKKARREILEFMKGILPAPRPQISPYAPGIIVLKINPEKIGAVIGPGGKVINGLIKKYELASIDIEEDGSVFISGTNMERAEEAAREVRALTKEFKVGEVIEGVVVRLMDFGAIVDLGGGRDGMIHVSELKSGFVKNPEEVVKKGDLVRAKVIRVDADGRIGLSLKQMG